MKELLFNQMSMNRWSLWWRSISAATAAVGCVLATGQGATAALEYDLGHRNWELVDSDYAIAAELIEQNGDVVVFDLLIDFDLNYARLRGDCQAMTVEVLRHGGFVGMSGSVVTVLEVQESQRELLDASEGQKHHAALQAACLKRG